MNDFLNILPPPILEYFESTGVDPLVGVAAVVAVILLFLVILVWRQSRQKAVRRLLPEGFQNRVGIRSYRQALRLQGQGKLSEAARSFAAVGLVEQAADLLAGSGDSAALAAFWIEQSNPLEAARHYAHAGLYREAAQACTNAGDMAAAAAYFVEAGDLLQAARAYSASGDQDAAARCLEEEGETEQALSMFMHAGDESNYGRLAGHYLSELMRATAGSPQTDQVNVIEFDTAMEGAEAGGHWASLFALASFQSDWQRAALAMEKLGKTDKAISLYRKGEVFDSSARLLQDQGNPAAAELDFAQHFELQNDFARAAQHYINGGQSEKAVDLFRKAGDQARAAEILFNLGKNEEAAKLFEETGDCKMAGNAYLQADMQLDAARCLARTDEAVRAANLYMDEEAFADAGRVYEDQNMMEEAIKAYQKHTRTNPDDVDVAERVAALLEEKGLFASAIETYNALIGGRPVAEKNIHYYYRTGRLFERLDKIEQARRVYEKIMAYDLTHEDVEERVDNLKRQQMLNEIGSPGSGSRSSDSQRYRIERELGKGGMGAVYLAHDKILDRKVALKVMQTRDLSRESVDRLMEEARISARLNHANIVTIFDVSLIDGSLYLAMEYVDGQTIRDIVNEQGHLPLTPLLLVFGQACQGLAYAHTQNVVHRDIKPANLMWTPDRKLKIMDFGLALAAQEMANTQTLVVGTPYYMSPEQVMGDKVDGRSDLYSLGVTMYEAATGRRPFRGGDVGYHHVHTVPEEPRMHRPDLPDALNGLVMDCMQKKPEDRPESATQVLENIKRIIQEISKG